MLGTFGPGVAARGMARHGKVFQITLGEQRHGMRRRGESWQGISKHNDLAEEGRADAGRRGALRGRAEQGKVVKTFSAEPGSPSRGAARHGKALNRKDAI